MALAIVIALRKITFGPELLLIAALCLAAWFMLAFAHWGNRITRRGVIVSHRGVFIVGGIRMTLNPQRLAKHMSITPVEVGAIRFRQLQHGDRCFDVMVIDRLHDPALEVGLAANESPAELREYMSQWGYSVTGDSA